MSSLSRLVRPVIFTILLIVIVLAYIFSIQVTQPDLIKLVKSAPKAKDILSQLLSPDLVTRETGTYVVSVAFPIPCGSAAEGIPAPSGPRIIVTPGCAEVKENFTVEGFELDPRVDLTLRWKLPDGNLMSVQNVKTDADGHFSVEMLSRPIAMTKDGIPANIEAEVNRQGGKLIPTSTVKDVIDAMFVTIFMALIATTIGTVFAIPMSFLAASNITRRGIIGTVVYYIVRAILNIIRSYEPLVMATVFALIVGFGSPFAGVLALVIVTTASLGKMFSESVESIDPGPIEALTATGANRLSVIIYSVIPQIIPDFLSFTIYHWDINVRISTVIGFVGGGGIGFYLSQRINTFEYSKAGTALLAIIIVVWCLDFLSARIRKFLV
jgi:phosphonate transport system permease protein